MSVHRTGCFACCYEHRLYQPNRHEKAANLLQLQGNWTVSGHQTACSAVANSNDNSYSLNLSALPAGLQQLCVSLVQKGVGARPSAGAVLTNAVFHQSEVTALRTIGQSLIFFSC